MKLSPWDCHLKGDVQRQLSSVKRAKTLTLGQLEAIVTPLHVKRVVLGGMEPCVDEQLIDIINLFNSLGIDIILLTNGLLIGREFIERLENVGLREVCVSIKAYTENLHKSYTGQSNRRVLKNFRLLSGSNIMLRAESILIPELIEKTEIERIAKFIASIDPLIPYRVDGYIPVPGTHWRRPSEEEVFEAVDAARRHLKNVSCIHSQTKIKGEATNIYPNLETYLQPRT